MIAQRHAQRLRGGAAAFAAGLVVVGASVISSWGYSTEDAPPTVQGPPPGYGTALYVQEEAETEQVWTKLAAAIDLVLASRENLTQAEALRDTAARLAQISRENVDVRKEKSDPAALESARYHQLVAESQLMLAEDLLAKARRVSDSAVTLFELARQNAFRPQESDESQESDEDAGRAFPGLIRTVRPRGAARRNRSA